jgi:hypothetical protein
MFTLTKGEIDGRELQIYHPHTFYLSSTSLH